MGPEQEKLVEDNLQQVITVAEKYKARGVSLADLVQAGNLGLVKAAEKYDPASDIVFELYALWYIRQAVMTEVRDQQHLRRMK